MKNKKSYLIIGITLLIGTGFIIPFIFHKKIYTYYDKPPFGIIDANENVKNLLYEQNSSSEISQIMTCVKYDIYLYNLSLNKIENFILKRVTITDQIIDESGDIHYVLDLKTLFNIKYKKTITKKINPLLINVGCR